uniref:Potassium/proton antiporter CemA n=1 Tax=Johansenicoccus eremophilus TaxID=3068301 RepID=A0AA49LM76_9CHLO|nr:envelope membrane protein [Chlorophyceae sp. KF-2023a]
MVSDKKNTSGLPQPSFGQKRFRTEDRGNEAANRQILSITYEEIGLFPRSFSRVFDRFLKQIFSDVENLVLREYRFYRYLFLTTIKCLFVLLFVPFLVNFLARTYIARPIAEYFWNLGQNEIFLNAYQEKRAFSELKEFEEKLYFESLTFPQSLSLSKEKGKDKNSSYWFKPTIGDVTEKSILEDNKTFNKSFVFDTSIILSSLWPIEKMKELALQYNDESIEAISNLFADFLGFSTLIFLFMSLEIQINITKSFLLEIFFGLDDSKKSLLILFVTDLLVGYHSPNIWELFFQFIFYHYGIPESQTAIFLLVATLPVLLDVLFKYLIFRHLNRASPATVATYHAMIE